jgi:flagellar biosynthesis protein
MDKPASEHFRKAVALRYDTSRDGAPRIVAKGQRLIADRILAVAREHGIHIYQDPDLVGLLSQLDIFSEIPEELYGAVAEILAFVYRINNRMVS